MAANPNNLVLGAGELYIAAFGAAEPADTAVNTVPASGVWTNVGATMDGVTFTISRSHTNLQADQLTLPASARLTSETIMIKTNLAEPTLDNLFKAMDETSTQGSGSGFASLEANAVAQTPTFHALLFDGFAPGDPGYTRRVIIRKALQKSNIEMAYTKENQSVLSVEFEAYYVSSAIQPWKIIDETAA